MTINHPTDELMPQFTRYSVGDCEMLPRPNGNYIQVRDMISIIDWLTDEDNATAMLTKLDYLREAIS